MRVLDLFSGIGGFSLGLERAGFTTVAFCEIEPYCQAVLRKHWPDVPIYDDIRTLTIGRLAADGISVDVICGGFPCQDISLAGEGEGIEGERSGLWREYARLIGELRPRFAIMENVAALLSRGMDSVLGDLASLGFDAWWGCIRASDIGAEHERDRVWIVANSDASRYPRRMQAGAHGAHVADIDARVRLAVMAAGDFPRHHWTHKPVLGGGVHGLSDWLDRGLNAGAQIGSFEGLRALRRADVQKAVQFGPSGGHGALQKAQILRSGMPEARSNQTQCIGETDHDSASTEVSRNVVRGLQGPASLAHSSHGQKSSEQRSEQSNDVVRLLPQQASRRHARIAALGNAVVPQIPEIIGRAIMKVA